MFYLYRAHLHPSSLFVTENRENNYKTTCFLFSNCKSYKLQWIGKTQVTLGDRGIPKHFYWLWKYRNKTMMRTLCGGNWQQMRCESLVPFVGLALFEIWVCVSRGSIQRSAESNSCLVQLNLQCHFRTAGQELTESIAQTGESTRLGRAWGKVMLIHVVGGS